MKRGRKPIGKETGVKLVKATFLLEPNLKRNLAYAALAEKKEQSDIVREAITYYLMQRGLDPSKPPNFNIKPLPVVTEKML